MNPARKEKNRNEADERRQGTKRISTPFENV